VDFIEINLNDVDFILDIDLSVLDVDDVSIDVSNVRLKRRNTDVDRLSFSLSFANEVLDVGNTDREIVDFDIKV
jgi:hypothetical protein